MNSVKRRLSQTLGQIKKGFAVDTYEGGFPITQVIKAPKAASDTGVHAAVALTTAIQTVTTGITQPDVYRCIHIVGNQADCDTEVTINGTDWADRVISEVITATGVSPAYSNFSFKTVISLVFAPKSHNSQTISVGINPYLSLYRSPVTASAELLKCDGVVEATTYMDSLGQFAPTTAPNAAHNFEISYLTEIF
jgi:hypothetical protein